MNTEPIPSSVSDPEDDAGHGSAVADDTPADSSRFAKLNRDRSFRRDYDRADRTVGAISVVHTQADPSHAAERPLEAESAGLVSFNRLSVRRRLIFASMQHDGQVVYAHTRQTGPDLTIENRGKLLALLEYPSVLLEPDRGRSAHDDNHNSATQE